MFTELQKVNIKSKNELAKHLSVWNNYKEVLEKINMVLKDHSKYYFNHEHSKPSEGKFVRASKWHLRELNKLINERIFKGMDSYIPFFIFWWISKRSHIKAVKEHKIKEWWNRTYILLDLRRYFDQITMERVIWNLVSKLWCSKKWAYFIASLCCLPEGEKFDKEKQWLLARGFNTSSRISILASIEFFQRIHWFLQKKYWKLNPRVSVYVDDISISLDNTSDENIHNITNEIKKLADKYDLELHPDKEEIFKDVDSVEILWIEFQNAQKMSIWKKTLLKKEEAHKRLLLWDESAQASIDGINNYSKTLAKQ